jgi:hypothetical protein
MHPDDRRWLEDRLQEIREGFERRLGLREAREATEPPIFWCCLQRECRAVHDDPGLRHEVFAVGPRTWAGVVDEIKAVFPVDLVSLRAIGMKVGYWGVAVEPNPAVPEGHLAIVPRTTL